MGFPGGSVGTESSWNAGDQVQSLSREDPLEKGMATCSSILIWRIPWTEEPDGLQSMRSQSVRHDWMTKLTHTSTYITSSLSIQYWIHRLSPSWLLYNKYCFYEHWGTCIFFELEFLSFLDTCPGVGLLGHMVIPLQLKEKISMLFSIVAISIYFPTNNAGGFPFLHTVSTFIICRLFDDGHSDQYEMIPHYSFDLHFSNN